MNYFRSKKNTLCDYAITETFSKKEMLILSPSIYTRDLWRVMSKAMTENITNDWTQQDVYKRLARENILIVGGVCSGKTSLIEKLKHVLPHKIMDIGKLFRIIAYLVINDNGKAPINPDIKKIREGDSIEIERVAMALNCKINNIRSQFNGINIFFENEENTVYLYEINIEKRLYTVPIETLASIISKNKKVRKLLWKWMDLYAENNPGNIITGYSLSDTDTIKYRIINLRVEKREAAVRLINRGFNDFTNFDEAYNFIDKRNISDRIKETEQVIDGVYGSIIIDTTGFSSKEIKNELLKRLIETSKERDVKKKEQEKHGISRKNFEWQVNPFMEIIKVLSEDIFRCQAKKYKDMGISEFDLAIQTIIHLASKNMEDILKGYRSVQKCPEERKCTRVYAY